MDYLNSFENSLKKFLEFEFNGENINFRDRVFFSLLDEIVENKIFEKNYLNMIKNFIKKNIMINEIYLENKENIHYKNLNKIIGKIFIYLEKISLIFENLNDRNFITDFIVYLNKVIFYNKNILSNNLQNVNNNNSNNNQNNSIINNIFNLNGNNNIRENSGGTSGLSRFKFFDFFIFEY